MPELSERGESAQQRVSPASWRDLQGRGRGPAGGAQSAAGEGPGEPAGAGEAGGEAGGPRQECLGRGADGAQQAGAGAVRLVLRRHQLAGQRRAAAGHPAWHLPGEGLPGPQLPLHSLSAEDKGGTNKCPDFLP